MVSNRTWNIDPRILFSFIGNWMEEKMEAKNAKPDVKGQSSTKKNNTAKNNKNRGKVQSNFKKMAVENFEPNDVERASIREEIILIATGLVSLLLVLSYFNLCGPLGTGINYLIFGLLGIFAYVFPFALFFLVAFSLSNRGNRLAKKKLIYGVILLILITALIQIICGYESEVGYFEYFQHSWKNYQGEFPTYGGLFGGMITKLLCTLTGRVATILILMSFIVIFFMLLSGKALFAYLRGLNTSEGRSEEKEDIILERPQQRTIGERRIVRLQKSEAGEDAARKSIADEPDKFLDHLKKRGKGTKVQEEDDFPLEQSLEQSVEPELKEFTITGNYIEETPETVSIYEQEMKKKFGEKQEEVIPEIKTEDSNPVYVPEPATPVELEESKTNQQILLDKASEQKKQTEIQKETEKKEEIELSAAVIPEKKYVFPSLNLLAKPKKGDGGMSTKALQETASKLQHTLESFGVRVSITNISCGPSVTRYELQPEEGVKVSRITGLSDDIKLNLAAADIRIEAPIPGKAAVGIEVPNKENVTVLLREILDNDEFRNHPSNIAFAVGKDIGGQGVVTDIGKMPHLLIAGATGSGKSVCINTLVMSILYKAKPSDVRLIMIDPKVVELSVYNGIPHLMIPVVTDPKKASAALNWAVVEMTDRYKKFAEFGVRDIRGYNEKLEELSYEKDDETLQKLPQIVIIVDELADLMMVAPGEVEDAICRLAQMARAAGLHLIIATQRPSVNVITGLIKANVPSRIAFAVSSFTDSRTIIDGSGAEKLLGKGDMLFFPSGYPKPVRVQGAFVSDKEVSAVVDFLKAQNESTSYSEEISNQIASVQTAADSGKNGSELDDYFVEAGKFIIEKDKASIGMLQRVYKIGFNRAARIMDQLSDAGVVGPEEGTKPRKVLMNLEEFEQYVEESV